MDRTTNHGPHGAHVCKLTLLLEGEAVCLGCGAYYIFQAVLTPAEMEEILAELALDTETAQQSTPRPSPGEAAEASDG